MADQPSGPLTSVARTIGSAAGKLVAVVSGSPEKAAASAPAVKGKENLWQAEYVGSGTFVIHKPKRKAHKRRQQAVKSPKRGMRK